MSPEPIDLKLYVAGPGRFSRQAEANLRRAARRLLDGRHRIEVVDVCVDAKRALADGVFLTPMLVVSSHPAIAPMVGTLDDIEERLRALALASESDGDLAVSAQGAPDEPPDRPRSEES